MDGRGKVLNYKMTSQCASGWGQFLENIARYLGIARYEIGVLSKQADNPEKVSGICAVLAETDVINMVSRGITAPKILKGIHELDGRSARQAVEVNWQELQDVIQTTGGLALDPGLVELMKEAMVREKVAAPIETHADGIFAGAIGQQPCGARLGTKSSRASPSRPTQLEV